MYTSKPVGLSTKSSILDILPWRKSKSRDTIETYRHEVSTAVESKPSLRFQSDPTLSAQLQFYPHTDASTSRNLKFSSHDNRNSDADAPHNHPRISSKPQSLSKASVVGDLSIRNSCAIISCPDASDHDEIVVPTSSLRTEVMSDLMQVIQPNAGFVNSDNYYDSMESKGSALRYSAIDLKEKNSDEEPVEPMEPVCSYFGDEYETRAVE
ncbi:hypothetical protein BCR33DRAFT_742490 [Rhizoclosmatium globosum]|uniref:Uncharacterized protein n=1 Tax=Rhizoclosmatium globosum TaxID=329046 RepID=A0A1Y2BPY4_9FUNG|nr:hypothetical protein BCR33DRAFT_742490 [Rhizoclosmatium globosum]|eukprot:ORY36811.1 hypothetical protein BCR33DRAFT_742490 [Rhizoclosmatium globosum]